MSKLIDEHIHNDMHRCIMKLRLIDGWTYARIAEDARIDRTPRQVGYIISKYLPKLSQYLL